MIILLFSSLNCVNFKVIAKPLIPSLERSKTGTLTIWTNALIAPVLDNLADDLWNAYQISLLVEIHTNLYEDFFNAVPLGTGPDIIYLGHDRLGYLKARGYITPIDLGTEAAHYQVSALESITIDGELYGLPWSSECLGFFYNSSLVPTPPTTWQEAQMMGEALKASGEVEYGLALAGNTYEAYPLMTAFGGYVFGKDTEGNWDKNDLGIDGPGMIEAVQWMRDRVVDGFMPSDTNWDNAHIRFETGEIPFLMTGPWSVERISSSGIPYAITNIPDQSQSGTPFLGIQVFSINAASPNILMAENFLKEFISTVETMDALSAATGRPSTYLPSIANITDPNLSMFANIAGSASPIPNLPEMSIVWDEWNFSVYHALTGTQTPQDALTSAANLIRDLISEMIIGMVNVPGDYQTYVGCESNWKAGCLNTAMTEIETFHWKSGPFYLPAGIYQCRVALDGSWDLNYGTGGSPNGGSYLFSLAHNGSVTFYWDEGTKILTIEIIQNLFVPIIMR